MTLHVDHITAGYGRIAAVRDVSLVVRPGEMVAVLGRNGAGKSTLLRAIAGLQHVPRGQVALGSAVISSRRPWQSARLGLGVVLEGARVFARQTVAENLEAGGLYCRDRHLAERRLDVLAGAFPVLREKGDQMAAALSGGERMQLAIAQAVAASPRYLILDEPSVGLSPQAVTGLFDILDELRREGAETESRLGILIAEQMAAPVLRVADRAVVLDHGAVVAEGPAARLAASGEITATYLGIGPG